MGGVEEYPLFPLGTVLFPDGPLPLRIFEPRYLDMVSDRLRNDLPFGVCLIRAGQEVGAAARPFEIGTLAKIVDWHQYADGVLGITAIGTGRFRLLESETRDDQLLVGRCARLETASAPLPTDAADLAKLAERLVERIGPAYENLPRRLDDAAWVGFRLAELMPLPMARKQALLELEDPLARLAELRTILRALEAARPT